ncbi:MAG: ATP-binding cassette domain-containing protein [Planctomycetota bacterium]
MQLLSVDKRFGRQVALHQLSIHVHKGDCYGFLGHNGAGKTTALRIALGLILPDAGRVVVESFDASRHPREARARQGGLIETPGFYPWLSGQRNLTLMAGLHGLDRATARRESNRLLEVVGLLPARDKAVGEYSQGMRQRLGIARSLLGKPSLLLLDEPMNGLDPEGIEEFRRLIVRLVREEGRTVLFSSHQIHEVAGICNRIGILRQGRLVAQAETDHLLIAGDPRYVLRTADDEAAQRLMSASGIEWHALPEGGSTFNPEECPPAELVRRLVEERIAIVELARKPVTLEEIYLRYSRGEPSTQHQEDGDRASRPPVAVTPPQRLAPTLPTLRALLVELERITSHVGPIVLLALPAVLAALSVLRQWLRARGHMAELAEGQLFSHTLVTAFEGAGEAFRGALPLAAFIVAGLASQAIAGESSRSTLRHWLLTPVGRLPLTLGKAAAMMAVTLGSFVLLALTAVGAASLAFDFTDVVEMLEIRRREPWVLVKAHELWPLFLGMMPRLYLSLTAYAALGLLAGTLVRRNVSALALAAGSILFLDLFRTVGRELGFERWLLSAYIPSPLGDTSLVAHLLDCIRAPNDPPSGFVEGSLLIPLLWLASSVVLSALILRRRAVP